MPAPSKSRRGFKSLRRFDKNSRIVQFGDELMKTGLVLGKTDPTLNARKTETDLIKLTISDCHAENENDNHSVSTITTETTDSKFQQTNFSIPPKTLIATRQTSQRNRQSYSRSIFDLDYDANKLESTLDDPGVFRTDGVGGTSVSINSARDSFHSSLRESAKPFKDIRRQTIQDTRPWSMSTISRSGLAPPSAESRASSVVSAPGKFGNDNNSRNRSKSEPHALSSQSVFNKKGQQQIKKPVKSILKAPTDFDQIRDHNVKSMVAWLDKKVETVTIATQTDEDFSLELADE